MERRNIKLVILASLIAGTHLKSSMATQSHSVDLRPETKKWLDQQSAPVVAFPAHSFDVACSQTCGISCGVTAT